MNDLEVAFSEKHAEQEPEPTGSFLARLTEFTRLENRRRELEAELEQISKAAQVLKPQIIEDMAEAGVESTRANGLTVFTKLDWFVNKKKEVPTEAVCRVLEEIGRGDMVNDGYSASSLKALIAEWRAEEQEVPAKLADMLNIGSVVNLVTRR